MQYPINEMFQTLQGEGYFTGVPAIFIRLQGCPVGCAWCDTKHTWDKLADREVSLFSILAKTKESDKWGPASSEDLLAIIGRQGWTARTVAGGCGVCDVGYWKKSYLVMEKCTSPGGCRMAADVLYCNHKVQYRKGIGAFHGNR